MKIKRVSKLYVEKIILDKLAFYGKADPELVKKVSELLNRDLESKKDTEDYNVDVISEFVDRHVKLLMDAGLDSIKSGDVLMMDALDGGDKSEALAKDLQDAIDNKDYALYPFSQAIEKEMRAKAILKTSKKDTFVELMKEFDSLSANLISAEHLAVLKKVFKDAGARIFKEDLMFLNPPKGQEQGELRELTEFEKKAFGLDGNFSVDLRKDNHDLLALKELIGLMKGQVAHPLTMGPGFFCKYTVELKNEGFDGVVLITEDSILKKIELVKLPSDSADFPQVNASMNMLRNFSPTKAASLVFFNYLSNYKKEVVGGEVVINPNITPTNFKNNMKMYVVVDGMVSGPETKLPLSYESASHNNKRIPAGETFLLEKEAKEFILTRLYFYPHKPSMVNPIVQHGSVIYGINDMSFHSCKIEATIEKNPLAEEQYKDFMKRQNGKGMYYENADVATLLHNFPERNPGEKGDPTDVFRDKNLKYLPEVVDSLSEVNKFTNDNILDWAFLGNMSFLDSSVMIYLRVMLRNYYPLTQRWLVSKYMTDNKGITKEPQRSFYRKLVEDIERDNLKNILELNVALIQKRSK